MTDRSTGPSGAPETRSVYRGSLRDRLGAVERRARRLPPVRGLLAILDNYNAAGGGLLAAGLSFSALFAIIPGLLLTVTLPVLVLDDPALRDRIVELISQQLPPLAKVAHDIVDSLAEGARGASILALVGFLWGASGFYLALEGAMSRLFPGPRARNPVFARVRGAIAVVLLVGGVLAAFLVSTVLSLIADSVDLPLGDILPWVSPVIAVAAATGVAFVVYRIVPSDPPGWRAAFVPALLSGTAIGLLTSLFAVLAPMLVGAFSGLGALASVFVALAWFNYLFQALLYGAAFARMRRDRDVAHAGPPTL